MSEPRYFACRRVNPFAGSLQIVAVQGARAISPNGGRWQVELLSRVAVRQPLWADIGPASAEQRYFTYGVWAPEQGMRRLPVNPMLGDQSTHPSLAPLVAALERMPSLPFPGADRLELWLLDSQAEPLALVATLTGESPPTLPMPPAWRAVPPAEAMSPALAGEPPAPDSGPLERLVSATAGTPGRAQWFRRSPDGSGTGLSGFRLDPGLEGRTVGAAEFPELLVRSDWPADPGATALVNALLCWQAPLLLTLEHLSRETRERLEQLAARRPGALYRQRRLLPEVANPALVQAALVEAVIRAAG